VRQEHERARGRIVIEPVIIDLAHTRRNGR
jgi:hypothetical protein